MMILLNESILIYKNTFSLIDSLLTSTKSSENTFQKCKPWLLLISAFSLDTSTSFIDPFDFSMTAFTTASFSSGFSEQVLYTILPLIYI